MMVIEVASMKNNLDTLIHLLLSKCFGNRCEEVTVNNWRGKS